MNRTEHRMSHVENILVFNQLHLLEKGMTSFNS